MKKYYTYTFYMWLILAVVSLGVALWEYRELGDDAWWFFVAFGVAAFLCVRRYLALKSFRAAEKNGGTSKN